MDAVLGEILYTTLALFIILDPLLSVPIFAHMTKGKSSREVTRDAGIAIGVAGALMFLFLFGNFVIFEILGITLASFQIAGGIFLFLLGMQETLGITIGTARKTETSASVIIGTPLLCGPGTITTVLLFSKEFGIPVVAVASALSLAGSWLVLKYATLIQRLLGETVTDVMGKVLGMLVAAIAVKIIVAGIQALI
ncbi:MAG: MarC family protein [Methanomicrobiales archaeon]|nr:MarC family protein [Methanomicrobiales archaeon]MDD1668870.1 MarC family protein [Methanomicrobiales archaeon]